ncbi:hypothetical protein QBC41DRAFT_110374 [Cercophora samala]|uniref:Uncharacterized protein n=1 Tax=Cercophora samala TaxID=330535 RepID=A0AA39ZE10_9PEZI|nr:hypothetical protein QBC41DRAFT_110374 [Cercophora samala]
MGQRLPTASQIRVYSLELSGASLACSRKDVLLPKIVACEYTARAPQRWLVSNSPPVVIGVWYSNTALLLFRMDARTIGPFTTTNVVTAAMVVLLLSRQSFGHLNMGCAIPSGERRQVPGSRLSVTSGPTMLPVRRQTLRLGLTGALALLPTWLPETGDQPNKRWVRCLRDGQDRQTKNKKASQSGKLSIRSGCPRLVASCHPERDKVMSML